MSDKKLTMALLFGGRSAEHEVSILSARSVRDAAPKDRVEVIPICISKKGTFLSPDQSRAILDGETAGDAGDGSFSFEQWVRRETIDIVFPLVHGTFGEDGSLQGYLEILGLPYIGSGVTGSAVGMDKAIMKCAFAASRLPIVDYVVVTEPEWENDRDRIMRMIVNTLRLPYFAKPANAGSSVGVTKVRNDEALAAAVENAFRFDEKALIERGIDAREIEVSVLGNDSPEASVPGEVIAGHEFYDYEDKYIDDRSSLVIPAKLPEDKRQEIRRTAVAAFRAIGASGYARVDFFLERGTQRLYLNEINTIPGFTRISMYPKLWEASGIKYAKLIERLAELGLERSRSRSERFERTMKFFDEVKSLT